MGKNIKIFSLILVLLMLVCASVAVNKSLFGHCINNTADNKLSVNEGNQSESGLIFKGRDCIVNTSDLPTVISGYAGPVPLEIRFKDGKIADITALPNAETPSFFKRASSLFGKWIGKTPEEADTMKVDGISGATYSSAAIISNMNAGIDLYLGQETKRKTSVPLTFWVALVITLTACIVPLFVSNRIYHTIQLIANVVILGFWCGQFLDYTMILKYISSGFIFPAGITAILMLIAAFIYPIFGKPQYYCNHICPLGSAQQLVAEICHYKIHIPVKILKGLDWFRKILWAALMLLLWTDCMTGWMDLELFQAFQYESASWWIIGIASAFVLLSAVVSRPYCRFVCPTGSLFKRSENIG